jgi:hypothetical protein
MFEHVTGPKFVPCFSRMTFGLILHVRAIDLYNVESYLKLLVSNAFTSLSIRETSKKFHLIFVLIHDDFRKIHHSCYCNVPLEDDINEFKSYFTKVILNTMATKQFFAGYKFCTMTHQRLLTLH